MIYDDIPILIAVGPLNQGKSRLGPELSRESRRRLILAMLEDMLLAITQHDHGTVFVVTPDPEVDLVAISYGAHIIRDRGLGTNAAILEAFTDERIANAMAVLIIQGDLPQITSEQVLMCLNELSEGERTVVLVTGDDGGTSVLGIKPPTAIEIAFGSKSGRKHREHALQAGMTIRELSIAALASDVDTVDDLESVRATVGPTTASILEELTLHTEDGTTP